MKISRLRAKYNSMLEMSFRLSKSSRQQSDSITKEADLVLKEIEQLQLELTDYKVEAGL
jgi:hypothetical protein